MIFLGNVNRQTTDISKFFPNLPPKMYLVSKKNENTHIYIN